jgi:hypothetical protein
VTFQLWSCSLTGGWVPAVQGNSPHPWSQHTSASIVTGQAGQPRNSQVLTPGRGIAFFSLWPCPDKLWHPLNLLSTRGSLSRRQSCQDIGWPHTSI